MTNAKGLTAASSSLCYIITLQLVVIKSMGEMHACLPSGDQRASHYDSDLNDFRKWLPVGTTLADVSESTLKSDLAEMVGERKLAAATVRRRFACLRSFFRRL